LECFSVTLQTYLNLSKVYWSYVLGRPTKLTPDVHKKIVNLIKAGNYNDVAAQAVGINEATFYGWMKRGEVGDGQIYIEFYKAIKEASAFSEAHYLELIRKAAQETSWQAAAWVLERKHKDKWGRSMTVEGNQDKPISNVMTIRYVDADND